jgi:RNase P subunit RPR2
MTADQILREFGITVSRMRGGNIKTKCPKCGPSRRNKLDTSLSVKIDNQGVTFFCHHCGDKGGKYYDDQSKARGVSGRPQDKRKHSDFYGDIQRRYSVHWR